MKSSVKNFVVSAFKAGKSRSYVRESLFKKISDVEVGKALRFFDRISIKEKSPGKSLIEIPKLVFYSLKLGMLFIFFLFLRASLLFKKLLFGSSEEITFEEVKHSFSLASLFRKLKSWFNRKSSSEKKRFVFIGITILLILIIVFSSSFIFYKRCENSRCFKEMVSDCHRAQFVSRDLVPLNNKVLGYSFRGCKIEVTSLKNDFGIEEGKRMTCYFPYGLAALPQTRIEFCSGSLREEIQEIIISELHRTIGQNVGELNYLFKQGVD